MKNIPIHECFYTWQGEGVHTGRAAYFIRTYGCPVKCLWCDSAGTWHPTHRPAHIKKLSPRELSEKAAATACEFAVITGGEPTIHDLTALTQELQSKQIPTHLETCGAFPIQGHFDWITLSPKWNAMPLKENIESAHEIKLIIESPSSAEDWIRAIPELLNKNCVWLHPEWSQRHNQDLLKSISECIKQHGRPFRAGYQLHKLFNVDALDSNSAAPSPLGGNAGLGY